MAESVYMVTGGTGTVGRRVVSLLRDSGLSAVAAARHGEVVLDWSDPATWTPALQNMSHLYLLLPDHMFLPDGFLDAVRAAHVHRVVLHSDMSVDIQQVEPLLAAESAVRSSGLDWTIVRPTWFHQDLETFFRQPVMDGLLRVPVGSSQQTWIDADDIAAAGVAALQRADLVGEILNVTGPETASFPEVAATISHATGREVEFDGTEEGYRASLGASGVPPQDTEAILAGFRALAAHKHHPTPDLERATGRRGTPLRHYIERAAREGQWGPVVRPSPA